MKTAKPTAEQRLHEALNRLINGEPTKVKSTGQLTLNKINKEAGLGHSYIHKFPRFIEEATPIIEKYNQDRKLLLNNYLNIKEVELSEFEKLRIELNRERDLKDKYRKQKEDLEIKLKKLESLNNTLMYRVFELQNDINSSVTYMLENKV